MNLQLRAIETAGLEQRVARLELLLEEVKHYKDLDSKKETANLIYGDLSSLIRQIPRKPVPEQGTEASSLADSLNVNKS